MKRTVLCAALAAYVSPAMALNIVLTNDDGWESVGIQQLKTGLVAAGHNVVLSAPLGEQSGSSAAISTGALTITKERDNEGALEFSIALAGGEDGAEPATSALVGINIGMDLWGIVPDLVISGINAGANIGGATQISGTVGATIVSIAANLGAAQVPAVAISTDELCNPEDDADPELCEERNEEHFDNIAHFMVDVVSKLEQRARHRRGLLPAGVALNINYPPLALHEIAGVKLARQGRVLSLGGDVVDLTQGCFGSCLDLAVGESAVGGINGVSPSTADDVRNSDVAAYKGGYITIVPIVPDYTATQELRGSLKRLFRRSRQ